MGITIHYQGKINEVSLINKVTEELKDITEELEWKYNLIDDDKLNVKGIYINPPPNCEALSFLFDKTTGILKDRIILAFDDMGDDHYKFNHTKTQYAPIQVHIIIIKLLKYLKNRYINDMAVVDEGEFWDTNDAILLQSKFDFLNEMIDTVASAFSNADKIPNETNESLLDRIEKILTEIHERSRKKRG